MIPHARSPTRLTRLPARPRRSAAARNGCLGTKAAFFCDYVRRYLLADPALGKTVADRAAADQQRRPDHQDHRRPALPAGRRRPPRPNRVNPTDQAIGALAMVQPGTGEVLGISQSRPMGRDKKKGQTFLNYVVDSKYGDSNGFQAGSTFKVFVLAAALEQGLPTSTRFKSAPSRWTSPERLPRLRRPLPSHSTWTPGTTPRRPAAALRHVQGHPALGEHLLRPAGAQDRPVRALRAGQGDGRRPHRPRPRAGPVVRPSASPSVSPLEMASAYATLAARGKHCENRPVTQILNSDGKVFKNYPKKCEQVMQESTADTINDILRGVMQPGGFGSALALDKPSAGKTGTINSNMAVWFNGYTPTLATAAMIAGANSVGVTGHAQRPSPSAAATSARPSARPWPARCGPRPCGRSRTRCPTRTSPGPRAPTTAPDRGGRPRRHRALRAPGGPAPRRPRLLRQRRRHPAVRRAPRAASPRPSPRRRERDPRLDGHALPVLGPQRLRTRNGSR